MAVTDIEVVSVPVSDQERAKEFYSAKLGFTVQTDAEFGESMRWVMLRPPGGGTCITLVTWFETMPPGSLKGSVLGCDDLEKSLAELGGRGVTFSWPRQPFRTGRRSWPAGTVWAPSRPGGWGSSQSSWR